MRWTYERDYSAANKCCFCCHIRTGTLIFGLVHLLIQLLIASALVVYIVRPDLLELIYSVDPSSSTETSAVANSSDTLDSALIKSKFYGNLPEIRNVDNLLCGIVLLTILIAVSSALTYGVIKGQPKYMMPFFCIQLIDIGLSGMAMLSYFSSVQELKRWIAEQDYLPMRQQILHMSDDHLMVATLVIFVAVIFCKMYFIGVVWACYKYLQHYARMENYAFRRYNAEMLNNIEDAEMLLPPKYEDAIMMPNVQLSEQIPPPPAYSDE